MLVAEGLVKVYRGHEVVRNVNLTVGPNQVVGLVGANGAGKTTTIKMLAGLLEPTRGTARIDERPTLEPATRFRLGYLPEESPLYDDMHAVNYLHFFGSLYELPRARVREHTQTLLNRLGLDDAHWKKPLGTLSKGMRRKVAIARCLLHDPDVLILDEPTSGLDTFTASELNAFIRELRTQGKSILLSAHNLAQVEELCDEIHVMHRGAVVTRGSLSDLRARMGTQHYRVKANLAFPGSHEKGPVHEAWFPSFAEAEAAMKAIRDRGGVILEVESIPPSLEEIMRKASEA